MQWFDVSEKQYNPLQFLSRGFPEIFQNIVFVEHLWIGASAVRDHLPLDCFETACI